MYTALQHCGVRLSAGILYTMSSWEPGVLCAMYVFIIQRRQMRTSDRDLQDPPNVSYLGKEMFKSVYNPPPTPLKYYPHHALHMHHMHKCGLTGACKCIDSVSLRVWNWDIDYAHYSTSHVAALALPALTAPFTHTLALFPGLIQLLVICTVRSCAVKMLTAGNASSLPLFSYSLKMLSITKYMHVEPDIPLHVL